MNLNKSAFFNKTLFQQMNAITALVLFWTTLVTAAPPTVNGLFYGDGDDGRYVFWQSSASGLSNLHIYYDTSSTTLYAAMVVGREINDNVFDQDSGSQGSAYMQSAGWKKRSYKKLTDSEFASFTFECAQGSQLTWAWQQGYACLSGSTWVSDSTCTSSTGTAPPSIDSSSSIVANINTFQAGSPPRAWAMCNSDPNDDCSTTDIKLWKSPFDSASPNTVIDATEGYPATGQITYSSTYEYEWSMVYEWSINLTTVGCGNNALYLVSGNTHHSPGKNGEENDPFPNPPPTPDLSDFGDLPDTYSTIKASTGAQHYITATGPYLGSAIDMEPDGIPDGSASGDNLDGQDDEDGVTANVNQNWTVGTTQTFTISASANSVLGAWLDWNGNGTFEAGEYVTMTLVTGNNTLNVTVGNGFDWNNDNLSARFRVFSSGSAAPGGILDASDFSGLATDGEVEDYVFLAGTLPVTLNAFSSQIDDGVLTVNWQTATETDNVGFEILGKIRGKWHQLGEFIETKGMNSELPQDYKIELFPAPGLKALKLVDNDTRGRPEQYGPYKIGESFGETQAIELIDWESARSHRQARLIKRGFKKSKRNNKSTRLRKLAKKVTKNKALNKTRLARSKNTETAEVTHIAVTHAGIQRVTYEALRDNGLDLDGVRQRKIAITYRGNAVSRWISGGPIFGPGSAIEFLGKPPEGDDALYIKANLYQVAANSKQVKKVRSVRRSKARNVSDSYMHETLVDRPLRYIKQSPTGDPWIEQAVVVLNGQKTVNLDIPIHGSIESDSASLILGLGTVTDLPDIRTANGEFIQEHNVEIWFSGPDSEFVYLTTASTSGQQNWHIEADIPIGLIQAGVNRIQLRFSTEYRFSLVLIDYYGVRYAKSYLGPQLNFTPDLLAEGYRVEGFNNSSVSAYGEGREGKLKRINLRVKHVNDSYFAKFPQIDGVKRYWISDNPNSPDVFTTVSPANLMSSPADLVIISDSSFIGTPALNDYLADKAEFNPIIVDIEDIYNEFGFGMALPNAITDYLKNRDEMYPFTHVQLVGTDCYDRLNYLSECMSYIPLPTAKVGINIYSPNQNRLVDLDGDGVGDKAIAQFSVRDEDELATIVQKGADWQGSGLSGAQTALLIAEESDGVHSFIDQIERLNLLLDWDDTEILDLSDHPDINTAFSSLQSSLATGRTLTMFSGHASASIWAIRSLLTESTVQTLNNTGLPSLFVPLSCETSYDISPNANVLGHQLLYTGDRGALAISAAAALSNLDDNELMANYIINGMNNGFTLGESVQIGREALGPTYQTLLDNWLTQGDVTIKWVTP